MKCTWNQNRGMDRRRERTDPNQKTNEGKEGLARNNQLLATRGLCDRDRLTSGIFRDPEREVTCRRRVSFLAGHGLISVVVGSGRPSARAKGPPCRSVLGGHPGSTSFRCHPLSRLFHSQELPRFLLPPQPPPPLPLPHCSRRSTDPRRANPNASNRQAPSLSQSSPPLPPPADP